MLEFYFQDPDTIKRIRKGLFGPYIDSFADELKIVGYSWQSAQQHILFAEGFGIWLKYSRVDVDRVTLQHIDQYVRYRERHQQRTKGTGILTALKRIVKIVRAADTASSGVDQDKRTPVEVIVDEYDRYLLQDRGLVAVTVQCYSQFVKKFLTNRFKSGPMDLIELRPRDVLDFVKLSARSQSVKRLKLLVTSLRSFFQFAKCKGYIVLDLGACVPTVADWSKTGIPRALPMEKIKSILSQCKRNTAIGRRDYAILLLLARLGLRANEVVALKLEDIDWKDGYIVVRGKGRKACKMPLPSDVGEAIAAYVRDGRPNKSTSRNVFLRRRAPYSGFTSGSALGGAVRNAIKRSGIVTDRKGTHQFRHGLAVHMLKQGASLREIGEVLRHASLETTSIYAKVDTASLRALALPWPGGEQ